MAVDHELGRPWEDVGDDDEETARGSKIIQTNISLYIALLRRL